MPSKEEECHGIGKPPSAMSPTCAARDDGVGRKGAEVGKTEKKG